jgi:hypothetical protein
MTNEQKISAIPADSRAFIGISYGPFAFKWGPYTGEQVGKFLNRLLEADPDNKRPFFASVEIQGVDDPVPEIIPPPPSCPG